MRAFSQLGRRAEMRTAVPDIAPAGPPAGRTGLLSMHQRWSRGHVACPRLHHRVSAATQDACVNTPRPTPWLPLQAATAASAHASAHAQLLFALAKLVGVPNPCFQLIISTSRPSIARFRAKLAYTNSNDGIRFTIREDTEIRPKILYRR